MKKEITTELDSQQKLLSGCQAEDRRRQWQSTPVHLPEKSHGRRNLVGYSPWGCKESDMTERLLSVLVGCFEILDLLGKSETLSLLRDSAVCTLLCSDKAIYRM